MKLAWGAKLTEAQRAFIVSMAAALGTDPSWNTSVIQFESRWNPQAVNAQSGATGLIQFMPSTAIGVGTTVEAISQLDIDGQLPLCFQYWKPYAGRMKTLSDCYMAVLYPAAIGLAEDSVIFPPGSKAYLQNRGLDINHDNAVTKAEAASFVAKALADGLRDGNAIEMNPADNTEQPDAVAAQPEKTGMDPLSLVGMLASVFAPLIRAKIEKVAGTDVGKPLVDNLLGMAQQLTGKTDPLEAVAVARQNPAIVAQMEATTEDWFKQIAPAVDKIAALEKGEWDAEELSRNNAADRGARMQEQGPLLGNPQFLIAIGILLMVAGVVLSVLWKDAILAMFIGKEALGPGGAGFSTDMQAFVIGAIVGAALTAVIGYFFGSTRQSAAKDLTIGEMARRQPKGP